MSTTQRGLTKETKRNDVNNNKYNTEATFAA